jgi:alcohol dehydrogenase class IV
MWYFWSPNLIYGEDALDFIENITGEKCFIVTDKVIEELGYLKILTDKLDELEKDYKVFTEVKPDPHEEDVLNAKEMILSYEPDLLFALGGGSVMDTAKALWVLYEFPDYTLDDIHPFGKEMYNLGDKAKLIAVPTTSGTGAETTYAVIISRYEDGIWKKLVQAHKGLVPTYAIIDPVFPVGMPEELTKSTAFDALAHSIENFANNWSNEFSNALGLKAVEMIFEYLPKVVDDPKNTEYRDHMHQAATMAGLAFGNSSVHIGHALAHSWGSIFHTHHGKTVGIIIKYVVEYLINDPSEDVKTKEIYGKLAKQLGWSSWDASDEDASQAVPDKIEELQKKIGFPRSLGELGVSKEELEENLDTMVQLCFQDPTVVMSPRSPNTEQYKRLFRYAFEGKDIDF